MNSRMLVGIAALSSAFGMAIGCGGSETTELPPSPYATEAGFCQKLAEASCTKAVVQNCYLSDDATLEADTKTCRQQAARPAACNPNGYAYRQEGAEACIQAVGQAYADGKLTVDEIEAAGEACLAVYSGGKGPNAECDFDHECSHATGLSCVVKTSVDDTTGEVIHLGTCQEAELKTGGQKCGAINAVCDEGYYCTSADQICAEGPGVDDACSELVPCGSDALCVNEICEAKKGNGSSCEGHAECAGGFCIKSSGATSGTCGSILPLSPTTADSCSIFLP
jgi:hypothetical protein